MQLRCLAVGWLLVGLVGGLLGGLLGGRAAAQPAQTMDVAVNGPEGALLFMDGQAMGKLPLPTNLAVPAGPHQFRLELGRQKAESDVLTFSPNRRAELNLTLSGRTLIAVLRAPPGLFLILRPDPLPAPLRAHIYEEVAATAKQEHAILLGAGAQAERLPEQAALLRCAESGDCHMPLGEPGQLSYVLSVSVDAPGQESSGIGSSQIRMSLLDVRTADLGASAEENCASAPALPRAIGALAARLLQETASRPRGTLAVTSTPAGAKVLVDGRWLGMTPYQREAFTGPRAIEVQRSGHLAHKETVQVEADQAAAVQATLLPAPRPPLPRPLPRLIVGGILIAGGVLMAGFGVSALLANDKCVDGSEQILTCPVYFTTTGVGGGFLGAGSTLTVAGILTIAIP